MRPSRAAFCIFAAVAILWPAVTRAQEIPPELRAKLKTIRLLEVTYENRDVIWDLRKNPGRADVIELRVYGAQLPLEQIDIIKTWMTLGRGTVIYGADDANEHPSTKSNRILATLLERSITVDRVRATTFTRSPSASTHPVGRYAQLIACQGTPALTGVGWSLPYAIRRDKTTEIDSLFETDEGKVIVAAWSLPGGGRIIYGGCDPSYNNPFKNNVHKYDTGRFWANALLWLTRKLE